MKKPLWVNGQECQVFILDGPDSYYKQGTIERVGVDGAVYVRLYWPHITGFYKVERFEAGKVKPRTSDSRLV